MLTLLKINQFTLVESLELDVARGFTVITGETGAGKSVLLDALGLCLGDKADGQAVRHGADRAELTALFDVGGQPEARAWLSERELDDSSECSLRRVIHKEGRSKAWINGTPVTLGELRALGELLISIHSQHAYQGLLKKDSHRALLDNVGGLHALAGDVAGRYQAWQQARQALADSQANRAAQQARLELLASHLDELDKLALKAGEYETLEQEHDRLANFEALMQDGQQALAILNEGDNPVSRQVQLALKALEHHTGRSDSLRDICETLHSALIEITDSSRELSHFLDSQELDPQRLAALEHKIGEAQRLARKHKLPASELPDLQTRFQQEQAQCQQAQDIEALEQAVADAEASYMAVARELGAARRQVAPDLAGAITRHLQELGMPDTRIEFAFTPLVRPASYGLDDLELLFSANLGQAPQPLAKVASGGELSRFALAVQVIQAQHSAVPVLVFDEVDVGISGGTAEVVGNLLRQLGQHAQILCITHQPQVAAKGHQHWRVEKFNADDKTLSRVVSLDREQRVQEIARMSGGVTITQETLGHARSMLG